MIGDEELMDAPGALDAIHSVPASKDLAQVYKAPVTPLLKQITPGSIHGKRIVLRKAQRDIPEDEEEPLEIFAASGTAVHRIVARLPASKIKSDDNNNDNQVLVDKNGIPIPVPIGEVECNLLSTVYMPHTITEIQNLTYDRENDRLGCIDSLGNIRVCHLDQISFENTSGGVPLPESKRPRTDGDSFPFQYSIPAPPLGLGEDGWTGLAFDPNNKRKCVSARFFGKDVFLYDQDKVERMFYTAQAPTSITYVENKSNPGQNLIAITEFNQLAVYDPRASGAIERLAPTRSCLYCIGGNDEYLGVAGADRNAYIYDIKKWAIRERWTNCLKYPISYIGFANQNKQLCYTGGIDMELRCADIKGKVKRTHGLYVDSRWVGIDKDERDTIAGMTISGNLCIIRKSYNLEAK